MYLMQGRLPFQPQIQESIGQIGWDLGRNLRVVLLLGHLDRIVKLQQLRVIIGSVQPADPDDAFQHVVHEFGIPLGFASYLDGQTDAVAQVHSDGRGVDGPQRAHNVR